MWHRCFRLFVFAVGASALLGVRAPVNAYPFDMDCDENDVFYIQGTSHTGTPLFHNHDVANPSPGGPDCFTAVERWNTPFDMGESLFSTMYFNGSAQHVFAPHPLFAELPNGPVITYFLDIPVGPGPGIHGARFGRAFNHGTVHADVLSAHMAAFWFESGDRGWVNSSVGKHEGDQLARPYSGMLLGSSEVPPIPGLGDAVGVTTVVVDPVGNQVTLHVVVHGILTSQLVGSGIYVGGPGTTGPLALDLGGSGAWQTLGQGMSRQVEDAAFPPGHMSALLAGNCYLNVLTTDFPAGEIRGQITENVVKAVPALSPWALSILSGILLAAFFVFSRFRLRSRDSG